MIKFLQRAIMQALLATVLIGAGAASASAQVAILTGPVDTVIKGTAANRSAVIGFSGTANAATSSSTSLVVNTTSNFTNQPSVLNGVSIPSVLTGIPMIGQIVAGTGITTGTTVTAVTANSATQYTLTLSAAATVALGATVSSGGPQQIMAANPARRGVAEFNQSAQPCYVNGTGSATSGPDSLPVGPNVYDLNPDSFVSTSALSMLCLAPAAPVFIRER